MNVLSSQCGLDEPVISLTADRCHARADICTVGLMSFAPALECIRHRFRSNLSSLANEISPHPKT